MDEIVKIPNERIGVVIGPSGSVKEKIMKETKTNIEIDSHQGEVFISGEGEDFFKARDTIKAIARGFSPKRAYNLLKKDFLLHIIDIPEIVGRNSSNQKAKRGRVIGKEGRARKEIEKRTNSLISVYGKTIAIISSPNDLEKAIEAVTMLLKGSKHETMESFLNNNLKNRFEL